MTHLLANWPAPAHIQALTTSRLHGVSLAPYSSNNLALHVGDDPTAVQTNRSNLQRMLNLPGEPAWLEQTHSNRCIVIETSRERLADAAVTRLRATPLVIMTADCLPIMLCDRQGTEIAAIHAGWRGLMQGIIEHTLAAMHHSPTELIAWIGPAICQKCYEVGHEVFEAFTARIPSSQEAFQPQGKQWLANLAQIAEGMLLAHGVSAVYLSGVCSYENREQCYSYRRSAQTGRMATLIWFKS